MCSTRSVQTDTCYDGLLSADAVLDIEHISRHADAVGPNVTRVRGEDGVDDLVLSTAPPTTPP
jgi:hypothetical protein